MSKEALKWLETQRVPDVALTAVLGALAWLADKGTGECLKSQATIASKAGLTDRSVRYSLILLEQLEIIERRARSNGKYGRTTDSIAIALDRNFDVSKATLRLIRKAIRTRLQPEPRASGTDFSNRNLVPLQPEPGSREYNQGYQEEDLAGKNLAPTVDVEDTHEALSKYETRLGSNVIALKRRGEA